MTSLLIINGPNINMLGKRDPSQYGELTLGDLETLICNHAKQLNITSRCFQSNHEGSLIEFLQQHSEEASGIILNPAGLTLNGYGLLDACIDSKLPMVEVHLSNIGRREEWRKASLFTKISCAYIAGLQHMGYIYALEYLVELIKQSNEQ
jgi:3-dehydroquinate dehydratase-2